MSAPKSLVTLLLLCGCGDPSNANQGYNSGDIAAAAPGRLEGASETLRLGTSVQAPVAKLFVQEGDIVKAGQILLELNCRDLEAETNSLRAKAAAAKAHHQ